MLSPHDHEVTPAGWQQVVLRGGPYNRQRLIVPITDDRIVLFEDAREHQYFRTNDRAELTHESLVGAAFKGGAE
jgi:hypothetical protein